MAEITPVESQLPKPNFGQLLRGFVHQHALDTQTLYAIGGKLQDPLHPETDVANVRNLSHLFGQDLADEVRLRITQRGYIHMAQQFGFPVEEGIFGRMKTPAEFAKVFEQSKEFVRSLSTRLDRELAEKGHHVFPVHPLSGEALSDDSLVLLRLRSSMVSASEELANSLSEHLGVLADMRSKYGAVCQFEKASEKFTLLHTSRKLDEVLADTLARAKVDVLSSVQHVISQHQGGLHFNRFKWENNPERAYDQLPEKLDEIHREIERTTWVPRYDPDRAGHLAFPKGSVAHALLALDLYNGKRSDVLARRVQLREEKKARVTRRRATQRVEPLVVNEAVKKSALDRLRERATAGFVKQTEDALLASYGLNPDVVYHRWGIGGSTAFVDELLRRDVSVGNVFENNLKMLKKMEALRPGIAKTLYEEFGVLNYSRYPMDMLIDQYDHCNDTESNYGLLLFGTADYNGAFLCSTDSIKSLYQDAKKTGMQLRICEADTKIGLAKSLVKLRRRYAKKISFAVVGGHGSHDSIQLGGPMEEQHIYSRDLEGDGVLALHDFFEDGATIILASCDTGMYGGIAHTLYNRTGFHLVAPDNATNVLSLRLVDKNGRLTPEVRFWTGTRRVAYGEFDASTRTDTRPGTIKPPTVSANTRYSRSR